MNNDIEIPRLKKKCREQIVLALREEFKYANVMQILGLTRIMVNMGVGEAAHDSKTIDGTVRDLTVITGQKSTITRVRESIAQFKLYEGIPIDCHVALHGNRIWESADRLLTLALSRIRDFHGLSNRQFDGKGSYTFRLNRQVMSPEIGQNKIDHVRGTNITLVTSITNDQEGHVLLKHLGFPFEAVDDPESVKDGRDPVFQPRKKG